MITVTSYPRLIRATKGQYLQVEVAYKSTLPLVGSFMQFNLQMFGDSGLPSAPTGANTWNINYQLGTNDFTFFSNPKNRNLKVELIATSSTDFSIRVSFFMVADVDDWIGVTNVDNTQIFADQQFGVDSNIYTEINKYLNFYLLVNNQEVIAPNLVTVSEGCTLSVQHDGFYAGEDLQVNLTGSNNIDHEYFVLLYNTSDIFNGVNFVTDLKVNYASITDDAYQVDDLPFASIKGGMGFQSGEANFIVDGAYLEKDKNYFAIVIYRENGVWRSCEAVSLFQNGAGVPPVYGDISCQIANPWFGQTEDGCCGRGIAEDQTLRISGIVDIASWNTAISNYFTGTFYDYFVGSEITWSNQIPTTPILTGQLFNVTRLNNSGEHIIAGDFIQNTPGQFYVIVTINMSYPTHDDTIVKVIPINLGVEDFLGEILSLTDGDGNPITGDICYQQNGNVRFTFEDKGTQPRFYYSLNGGAWIPADNSIIKEGGQWFLEFDAEAVGLNNRVCFRLLYNEPATETDPDEDCDCSRCDSTTSMAISRDVTSFYIDATFPNINGTYNILTALGANYTGAIVNGNANIPLVYAEYPIVLNVNGATSDGCYYSGSFQIAHGDVNNMNPTTRFLQLTTCDCEDIALDPSCGNSASILFECDPETETITISYSEITFFPIESDVKEISYDGGDTWEVAPSETIGETSILLRRTISFFGACPEIYIIQSVVCEGTLICDNSRIVEWEVVDNLLTITVTDDINSNIVTDSLQVSIDGGVTFADYAAPIVLSGGEIVIINSLVTFDDGCPNLTFQTSFLNDAAAQCDYDGFDVFCDEVSPDVFEAIFEGDETGLVTNIKEYSVDGGATWSTYSSSVEASLFLVRWVIKYENCDTVTLISACSPECKKIRLCEPLTFEGPIEVTGSVSIEGCVNFCDNDCPPEEQNEFGLCP